MDKQENIVKNQKQPDKLADTQEIKLLTSSPDDSASLAEKVEDQGKAIESQSKELKRMFELVLLGFAILLVMVGTLVWTAFTDSKHSIEKATKQIQDDRYKLLQQQYQFQQNEIETLQKTETTSAKINGR